ncbi:hypothetical protein [Roseibium polysiphoniae]|uniref:50S ribosomal protein L25 n=1 Tax=Roseibium polysiphoniae TaxID=2571221 RepID=A0ABR9C676_9HYPH|nr:hypothetical protein [Roseibium polysiphoniae]MBD8875431.1 hypothetical protein [Roseibium polysiphoniae]
MSDTKQIKILKDTVCGAKPVKAGDIVTAGKADARLLINLKKAEEVKAKDAEQTGTGGKPGDDDEKGGEAGTKGVGK